MPSEFRDLGPVLQEYRVDASIQLWIGGGIMVIGGLALGGLLLTGRWDDCGGFLGIVGTAVGAWQFVSALSACKNRLGLYENGLVQRTVWTTEVYRWDEIARLEATVERQYASGIAYQVDYSAWLQLKSGAAVKVVDVGLNRKVIEQLQTLIAIGNAPRDPAP